MEEKQVCSLCPRHCAVNRAAGEKGFCRVGNRFRIARADLHLWEEPPLVGKHGAGAVFFSGCNLRCAFCQNYEVSHDLLGRDVTYRELRDTVLDLQRRGAAVLDLVTPTPYADLLEPFLRDVRTELRVPVVWNCGGYESPQTVQRFADLVDVWMPDFKFCDAQLAWKLSGTSDYADAASAALRAMLSAAGKPVFSADGILQRGVLVRHLVLPGHRKDSEAVLRRIADTVAPSEILLSLMSQYTPGFCRPGTCDAPELDRRVTTFEYRSVLDLADTLGFDGYFQERSSAKAEYTPAFFGEKGI